MELKTYRAANMADALSQVKKDLGKDAVILHARTMKLGGVMGVGARTVVEITASTDARAAAPRMRPTSTLSARRATESASTSQPVSHIASQVQSRSPSLSSSAASIPAIARAYGGASAHPDAGQDVFVPIVPASLDVSSLSTRLHGTGHSDVRATGSTRQPLPHDAKREVSALDRPSSHPLATRASLNPVDQGARAAIENELASIKRLVGEVLEFSRRTSATTSETAHRHLPPELQKYGESLRRQGLSEHLINECMDAFQAAVAADPRLLVACAGASPPDSIVSCVAGIVPIARLPEPIGPSQDGQPVTIALIGPTGVGKTTTIAKLAATYRLRQGLRVGILAADTYRIAAVEQLRTYAGIIGVPLHVVHSPADVPGALAAMRGIDVVLLDTAGRSQRDAGRLQELEETLGAVAPDHTLLVLSSTVSAGVLEQAADRFALLRPSGLVFTKLDEAVQFGPAIHIARKHSIGLCHLTTGQDVPDNIEVADAARIAHMLLEVGGGSVS